MWYEQVTVARPMVPERDKDAVERRVFPAEVSQVFSLYESCLAKEILRFCRAHRLESD